MSVVYHIPLSRLSDYRGHDLIVRSERPQDLVDKLDPQQLQQVAYVQLHGLPDEVDCLMHWASGMAIEIVLESPGAHFPLLYRYAKWNDNHPVRIVIPLQEGFDKAVRLALSLQFSVKLDIGQPDTVSLQKLSELLHEYLYRSTVAQPLEFFHSVLLAWCREETVNLWAVQEDDPALLRYIDDTGAEKLPGKLASERLQTGTDPADFVETWQNDLLAAAGECSGCAFFAHCRGYFKWPRRDYDCAGIKHLLQTLQQAAGELRRDLIAAESNQELEPR
jgi:hypothetical protein